MSIKEAHTIGNPEDKKKGYDLIDGNLLKSVDFDVGKGVPLGG